MIAKPKRKVALKKPATYGPKKPAMKTPAGSSPKPYSRDCMLSILQPYGLQGFFSLFPRKFFKSSSSQRITASLSTRSVTGGTCYKAFGKAAIKNGSPGQQLCQFGGSQCDEEDFFRTVAKQCHWPPTLMGGCLIAQPFISLAVNGLRRARHSFEGEALQGLEERIESSHWLTPQRRELPRSGAKEWLSALSFRWNRRSTNSYGKSISGRSISWQQPHWEEGLCPDSKLDLAEVISWTKKNIGSCTESGFDPGNWRGLLWYSIEN